MSRRIELWEQKRVDGVKNICTALFGLKKHFFDFYSTTIE